MLLDGSRNDESSSIGNRSQTRGYIFAPSRTSSSSNGSRCAHDLGSRKNRLTAPARNARIVVHDIHQARGKPRSAARTQMVTGPITPSHDKTVRGLPVVIGLGDGGWKSSKNSLATV